MSKTTPQDFKHHGRLDPPYHLITTAVLVTNLVISITYVVHHHTMIATWFVILSIAVFVPFGKLRTYPLKVQDRVIRLEERLRLQALAPSEWHAQIYGLTEDQLIGLRFAPDDEVVALAKKALEENLTRKQIKERIVNWRADNFRL